MLLRKCQVCEKDFWVEPKQYKASLCSPECKMERKNTRERAYYQQPEVKAYHAAYRKKNKKKSREYMRDYYEKNRERKRQYKKANVPWLKHRMPIEIYLQMVQRQNHNCAICGEFTEQLCIDHNHMTNKNRGLLCKRCNILLGWAKDSASTLLSASNYLKSYE